MRSLHRYAELRELSTPQTEAVDTTLKACTYLALALCSQFMRELNRFHVASHASFRRLRMSIERLLLLVADERRIRHPNFDAAVALCRGAGGRAFRSTASDTGDAVVFDALPGARGPFRAAKLVDAEARLCHFLCLRDVPEGLLRAIFAKSEWLLVRYERVLPPPA